MAYTYADVMRRASTILQDKGAKRYSAAELKDWIDQGLVDIYTMKPNAKTGVVTLTLSAGTEQTLPEQYSMLIEIMGNVGGGRIDLLDNLDTVSEWHPGWDDATVIPNAEKPRYAYHDPDTPRAFTVIPGALATSEIRAKVGMAPVPGAAPTGGDALDPAKYTATVDLPDAYQTAVLHFALYRAFLKDADNPASATQATAHHEIARAAVAAIDTGERALSAGARERRQRVEP